MDNNQEGIWLPDKKKARYMCISMEIQCLLLNFHMMLKAAFAFSMAWMCNTADMRGPGHLLWVLLLAIYWLLWTPVVQRRELHFNECFICPELRHWWMHSHNRSWPPWQAVPFSLGKLSPWELLIPTETKSLTHLNSASILNRCTKLWTLLNWAFLSFSTIIFRWDGLSIVNNITFHLNQPWWCSV